MPILTAPGKQRPPSRAATIRHAELPKGSVVWITGASTGIGRALAVHFAKRGINVAVSARSADLLAELAAENAGITAFPLDVTNATAVADVYNRITTEVGRIDLAILNAGVWNRMGGESYDLAKATQSMVVNYTGVTNALAPVMADMLSRHDGHIAIVSSVAGYRGLPTGAAYAPTKAALISLAESLYPELKAKGVKLQVINPGFVETPMTDVNDFPMPFKITTDDAVQRIAYGLTRDKFEIVFPRRMAILMKLLRIIRYRQFFRIAGRL